MSQREEHDPAPGTTTTTITATTELHVPVNPVPLSYDELNPKCEPEEFFGPLGTFAVTTLCPLFTLALFYGCNETTGCLPSSGADWRASWRAVQANEWPSLQGKLWEWEAAGVYLAWYAFLVAAWAILPADKIEGTLLRDGTRKVYKMNGFRTLLLTLGVVAGIIFRPGGAESFTYIYDHWVPLVSASIAMSFFQAFWVYIASFQTRELLALGGNSGVFIYDFFMGRALNPTPPFFKSFDVKVFNELRPGLILWLLINISSACEQYVRIGRVTDSMWLVLLFQAWYVVDALYLEAAVLTTMDVTTDGFGFMLSIGDLTWVPFTYSLQARYLAFHQVDLGLAGTAGIAALQLLGYYIFRVSNVEKNEFRKGNNPKSLTYMHTERGTKLLTSGWWGRSRHPNYLGDWIMALAWCLPTGFEAPLTYFYLIYFIILLLHRQIRDDEACKKKYGKDWERYCEVVPYRIIPYIY